MGIDSIWQEHQDKLRIFVRSKVSNECDAKDLLQQIFLKVQSRHQTLRDRKKILNWFYQVTRNAIIDYYRSRKKTEELPENLPAPQKDQNNWALISRCVRPFIEELPKIYREALILSEIEGLDQSQVARKLGLSLTAAKARILGQAAAQEEVRRLLHL